MSDEQIDIRADLNAQDDDGYGWSTLSRARQPDSPGPPRTFGFVKSN